MSRFLTVSVPPKWKQRKSIKFHLLQRNLCALPFKGAKCLYQEPSELQPCDRQPDLRALVIFLQLAVIFSLCVTGEIIYKRQCPFDGNRVLQPRAAEKALTHHIRFRLTINSLSRTSGVHKKKSISYTLERSAPCVKRGEKDQYREIPESCLQRRTLKQTVEKQGSCVIFK